MNKLPVAAILYDFDKTLSPKDMQEYSVIEELGVAPGIAPTLATVVNILLQIVISYPAMKFWIMPET